MEILKIYLLFWLFSIFGWILEVIVCSLYDKKLVNRGFFIGPYCPIYGFGALIMLLLTPYQNHPFICFFMALVLCSILEYFTSFLMEKLFKIRWWDYSNDAFNINGRVCLRNAIAFGALGVIFTRYLNPFFSNIINMLSNQTIIILSIITLIVTLLDIIISFNAMNSLKNIINKELVKLKNKDATSDIKKLIHDKLKLSVFEKRLIDTYHLLEKEKNNLKNKLTNMNKKSGYGLLLIFIIIGTVIGSIISFIFVTKDFKIIIALAVSISSLIAILLVKVGDFK